MIEGIVGLPGSGKTLCAVAWMIKESKRRRVVANFFSKTQRWDFMLWDQMRELSNALAVIDEAHMWFSSRHWHSTKQHEMAVFQQHRKQGLDLWWIAQSEARVDVSIRELTAFIWQAKRIRNTVLLTKYAPEDMKTILGRKCVWDIRKFFGEYWTEQVIGMRDGAGYDFGRGEAYSSYAAGAARAHADRRPQIAPTHLRVELPNDQIVYWAIDNDQTLEVLISRAMRYWVLFGGIWRGELMTPLYRDSNGKFYEVNLAPIEVQQPEVVPLTEVLEEIQVVRGGAGSRSGRNGKVKT